MPTRRYDRDVERETQPARPRPRAPELIESRPAIVVVDTNAGELELIERELERRYGQDYRIICERSPATALAQLEEMHDSSAHVAVVLAEQWLGELTAPTSSHAFGSCIRARSGHS